MDMLHDILSSVVFEELKRSGLLIPKPDVLPPSVPMDYDWARVCSNTCLFRVQTVFFFVIFVLGIRFNS